MQTETLANALADEWLGMMAAIPWKDAAASIRARHPSPCGETTSIDEQDGLLEVSDSWFWRDEPEGDIRLVIEVFECGGSDEPIATRDAIIPRR